MNIIEHIVHDQRQRKRETSYKMSKDEAKVLLLEGITTKNCELVSLAVKHGARVRGAVDGNDVFATCLNNFDASVFNILFPHHKIQANKDLMALIMNGNRNCLDYFSDHIVQNFDCFSHQFRYHISRNTNTEFAAWFNEHFDECMENAQKNSPFRTMSHSLGYAFLAALIFAARVEHAVLTTNIVQQIAKNSTDPVENFEFDVFSYTLDEICKIAKTIDALPPQDKKTAHAFLNLQHYSLGGDLWMDNVLQRNPKHLETVLKSPVGCLYVEQRLTQPQDAERFLNTIVINSWVPDLVQSNNILRLKNVYKDWISSENLNIVQHLIGYNSHPVHMKSEDHVDDSDRKLIDTLLHINVDAFHTPFPEKHRLKNSTPFDCLSVELQSQVSKFIIQKSVETARPIELKKELKKDKRRRKI